MKLIKTASGKKQLKMSKKEWENIGMGAKWMRVPSSYMSKTASRNIKQRNSLLWHPSLKCGKKILELISKRQALQ